MVFADQTFNFHKLNMKTANRIVFFKRYYFMKLKYDLSVSRKYLCYSVGLNVMYFETCWPFANHDYSYFNPSWITWINGINNRHSLSEKIDLHEKSIQHLDTIKVRCIWGKNEIIDKLTEQQYSNEATYWRNIFLNNHVNYSLCNIWQYSIKRTWI